MSQNVATMKHWKIRNHNKSSWQSVLSGASTITLDQSVNRSRRRGLYTFVYCKNDAEAMSKDWEDVGADIRKAMDDFASQYGK
jgi:hypothetical protein